MPNLRKKRGKYYADFYDPCRSPTRKWVPLRTTDKQAATIKMVRLDREFARGEFDPWSDTAPQEGVLVSEAIETYLKSRSGNRPKTLDTDRVTLQSFERSLPPVTLVQHVEPRHVRAFLDTPKKDGQPRAAATTKIYHARVQTFLGWCTDQRLRKGGNPAESVTRVKPGYKVPIWLRRDEVSRLLEAVAEDARVQTGRAARGDILWLADVVRIVVGTGLRASELCNLRWSAIDIEGRTLTVAVTKTFRTKNGNERALPLEGEALATLRRLRERRESREDGYIFPSRATRAGVGEMLDRQYLNKRFKHYAEEAGLSPDHTFHSLRRTYASWLAQDGVDMYRIQKLMDHQDIRTTTRSYAHLAPESTRADVRRVFGKQASGAISKRANLRNSNGIRRARRQLKSR